MAHHRGDSPTATKAKELQIDAGVAPVAAFSLEALPGTKLPQAGPSKSSDAENVQRLTSSAAATHPSGATEAEAESARPRGAPSYRPEERQRGWTKGLARLEVAYQILNVIDMVQTLKCLDMKYCYEKNVFLGKHPGKLAMIGFTAATGIGHYALVRSVARGNTDAAKAMSIASLVVSGTTVALNFKELF